MTLPLRNIAALVHLAGREPDRPAVDDGERRLTIGETAACAAGVAREILAADPAGTSPVPVLVDRSVCSVVGLFGVLTAGRPIAAIDCQEPAAYIDATIGRLGATVVLDATRHGSAQQAGEVPVVRVAAAGRAPPFVTPVADDAITQVVFTSGSTGSPKGVAYDAAGMNRTLDTYGDWVGSSNFAKAPVLAPLSWSAGIAQALYLLPLGIEVVLRDPLAGSAEGLADWVDRHQFPMLHITPSLACWWARLLPGQRRLESVHSVLTVGEGLSWADVALIRTLVATDATIETLYGATEVSGSFWYTISADSPLGEGTVPLGRPTRPDLVRLEPISDLPDAPTEIVFVGGVAKGYWADPELTSRKFGVDADGQPTWRSGDLAVVDADGLWRHRGRADLLMKIRGTLVEPAEPEAVLADVPWLRRSVVMPHILPSGATRLVAHLEPVAGAPVDADALRALLRKRLPANLMPSIFVRHDALPLMSGGKIDRRRLLAEPLVPWRSRPTRLPSGEIEEVVTGIVTDVLGVGTLSPDDDLWELGCDSLAAVEIVAALTNAGFEHAGLADLIEATTPAAIAIRLACPVLTKRDSHVVVLNRDGARSMLWVIAGAGGSSLAFRSLANELGDDQPVTVVEAYAIHHRARPDLSIEAAARRYVDVIVAAQPEGPYVVAGHSVGGLIAYEVARRLHADDHVAHPVIIDVPPSPTGEQQRSTSDPRGLTRRKMNGAHARLRMTATSRGWRSRNIRGRYAAYFDLHSRAARSYRPVPVDFPITVIERHGGSCGQRWGEFAAQVDTHFVDGDHNSMLQRPNVVQLATTVRAVLDASRGSSR